MKTIIWLIIIIAIMLYIAGLEISFKPFSIKFNNLANLLGMIFLILAMLCWDYTSWSRGYKEGYKEGGEYAIKSIEKEVKSQIELIKSKENENKNNTK